VKAKRPPAPRLLLSGRNDNYRKAAAAEMGFSMQ
jgi:hypothetical protein